MVDLDATDVRDSAFLLGLIITIVWVFVLIRSFRDLRGVSTSVERGLVCRRIQLALFVLLISASTVLFNGIYMVHGWYGLPRVTDSHILMQAGHWMRVSGLLIMLRLATKESFGEWFWAAVAFVTVALALFI